MPPQAQVRPFVIQYLSSQSVTVGTTATQLVSNTALVAGYIDSLIIGLPSAAANPIFYGGPGVTVANGMEIAVGTSINLALNNTRELYELEFPLKAILKFLRCNIGQQPEIPVKVFDPSQIYVVAAASTDARVMLFPSPYV